MVYVYCYISVSAPVKHPDVPIHMHSVSINIHRQPYRGLAHRPQEQPAVARTAIFDEEFVDVHVAAVAAPPTADCIQIYAYRYLLI